MKRCWKIRSVKWISLLKMCKVRVAAHSEKCKYCSNFGYDYLRTQSVLKIERDKTPICSRLTYLPGPVSTESKLPLHCCPLADDAKGVADRHLRAATSWGIFTRILSLLNTIYPMCLSTRDSRFMLLKKTSNQTPIIYL